MAVILFIVAGILLAGSKSPLRESVTHYLSGEGSWGVDFNEDSPVYRQIFVPAHTNVRQIGFVVEWEQAADIDENSAAVTAEIADRDGNVVKNVDVAQAQLKSGVYSEVTLNCTMKRGALYELRLKSHMESEIHPALNVCGTEYRLAENREFIGENESADTQILAEYVYDDALQIPRYLKAMLLVLLTALGIAIGLPKSKRVRFAAAGVLLVVGPIWLGRELELLLPTNVLLPHAMKWNLGLMYLFEIIILLFTQSFRFTTVFCNVVLTVLYCANYFVHAFRGTYLKANEFTAIRTAANVVGKYDLKPTPDMAMCICTAAVLVCWGMCVGTGGEKDGQGRIRERRIKIICHMVTAAAAIALTVLAGHFLVDTDLLEAHGFNYYSGINQEYTYYFDGYLVGSMINIRYNRVSPPEGYSAKRVEEILEQYRGKNGESAGKDNGQPGSEELPHIILIMNESYSDLRVNGNLELSRENLSVLHSLKENTIKGYVNASVLGGGTANSEFEVFSGCNMGFLPDSYYAYEQAVTGPLNTMITNLKENGYTAYSMHPEKSTNWRRNDVYRYLGFDKSLWKEDFAGAEVIHSGVSDAATFEKVEELFENREQGEKLFIFDLTMQNHGYYLNSHVKRTVEAMNVDCDEADIYLSLIYETDRAFGELIRYFEAQDEKVIICMFGDHQPKFFAENFYEDIYRQTPGLSDTDKTLNLYKTPFVIWANYDIEEAEGLDIGMSYLGILLQETAGVEITPFGRFLEKQMAEYPVITVNGYVDRDGNYQNWSGDGTEFSEYRMIQYNYLFDKNKVEWGF